MMVVVILNKATKEKSYYKTSCIMVKEAKEKVYSRFNYKDFFVVNTITETRGFRLEEMEEL